MARAKDEDFEGFVVGDIYSISDKYDTKLIPRSHISYVSANYRSQRAYIFFGAIAILYGLYVAMTGSLAFGFGVISFLLGGALIALFFLTRRVGIVIASSGGEMFLETRGKNRYAMLEEIHGDLAMHQPRSAENQSAS